jgi:SAM-dependent methyltransferase
VDARIAGVELPGSDIRLMPALPSDYDSDPERWRSCDRNVQVFGDVHSLVARRIVDEDLAPVLDIGGGQGHLESLLPTGWPSIVVDLSPTQVTDAPHPKVRADASLVPVRDRCAGAVAALWMLYHLDDPARAVAEAARVLRPGGLFVASTASRSNDPELTDGYPQTPFDAEEAPSIVATVFGEVRVERWDAPMTLLQDRDAVLRYCRSHSLHRHAADRVTPPVWLTKRGCVVYARKQ